MQQKFCNGIVHVIKEGDTLYQLSRAYRVPVALLMRANPYVDVYNLQVGEAICIPMSRPFHGMMPNFGRPMRETMSNEEREEMTTMEVVEEEATEVEETECVEDRMIHEPEEVKANEIAVITDGKMSLGEILNKHNCSMEECMQKNNLSQFVIKENIVIMLPNKV